MEIPLQFFALCMFLYYCLRYVWELIPVGNLSSKAVLISGCDSGFGRALSIKCAKAGMTVFAGCLTEKGAETLQAECQNHPLKTLRLDVTKDESVAKARTFVLENLGGKQLWAVVNNAGVFSCYGPDDWSNAQDYKDSFEVNTLGVVRCTQAFMDKIKESEGRIISVASVSGRFASAGTGPYTVAKYGVEAYMDVIRQETYYYNVKCSILEPGIFRTTLLDRDSMNRRVESVWSRIGKIKRAEWGEEFKENFKKNWNEKFHAFASPRVEYVVDNYFHAITARYPRHRYICGWDALFFFIPMSFLPSAVTDFVMRFIGRTDVLPIALQTKLGRKQL